MAPEANATSRNAASVAGALSERYAGRTVLAIGAHPDDVEVGMGGTVARLTDAGARVLMVAVCVPSQYEVRLREAQRASEILGAEFHLAFAGRCCRVEDLKTYELVARLDALVAECRPAALFSHGAREVHRDHQLVFEAARAALRHGGTDAFCFQPCSCRPGQSPFEPRAFVDIGSTLERKLEAISAHHSQFTARGICPGFHRDVSRYYGRQAGVEYAEAMEIARLMLL